MALPKLNIQRLTPEERIELAEALWDSLAPTPELIPLSAAQAAELDRRVEEYRVDGDPGMPWREALALIRKPA